jgi:hypothetical protein
MNIGIEEPGSYQSHEVNQGSPGSSEVIDHWSVGNEDQGWYLLRCHLLPLLSYPLQDTVFVKQIVLEWKSHACYRLWIFWEGRQPSYCNRWISFCTWPSSLLSFYQISLVDLPVFSDILFIIHAMEYFIINKVYLLSQELGLNPQCHCMSFCKIGSGIQMGN